MQTSIILTIFAVGLTMLTMFLGFSILFIIIRRKIRGFIADLTVQPDDKTPSKLATFVNQCCILASQHLVSQAKAVLMGMASVDARNEAKENTGANPLSGVLVNALGSILPKKFAKALGNSPVLSDLVMNYISKSKIAGGSGNNGNKPAPDTVQTQFPIIN
jgi:hypothetical protein